MSLTKVTNSMISGAMVNPFDFMTAAEINDVQSRTRLINVSASVQAAVDFAWANGKSMFFPAGDYLANIETPGSTVTEPRGLAFIMQGEGAGVIFLGGGQYVKGTTIISPNNNPAFTLNNILTASDSGPQIHLRDIRFEGTSTNPIVYLEIFNDFCSIRNCEIRQDGTGGGILFVRAYGGTVEQTHIANSNTAGTTSATGTGVDVQTPFSGGLLTFYKVSSRGWNICYNLGTGSGSYILSTTLQECEAGIANFGILINSGMRKTTINECFFEGLLNTAIQDKGEATTVSNCFMFESTVGPSIYIDSSYNTFGNLYFGNQIQINQSGQTAIKVASSGDASGWAKVIRDNFIYFQTSGGSLTNVVGINITGTNPALVISGNTFRPRRAWVGGAGTKQINNASTGQIYGNYPLTNTLNEYQMYSEAMISFAQGSTLTEANVTAGVLAVGLGCSIVANFTVATNVTAFNFGGEATERILLLQLSNTNMTLKDGSGQLRMAGDFNGPGIIMFKCTLIGSDQYAYEISRSTH